MISKGFYEELEVIANERHLDLQDVFKSVETALIKACQLEGAKGEINIEFNEELEYKIVGSTEANSLKNKISNESNLLTIPLMLINII